MEKRTSLKKFSAIMLVFAIIVLSLEGRERSVGGHGNQRHHRRTDSLEDGLHHGVVLEIGEEHRDEQDDQNELYHRHDYSDHSDQM